MQFPGTNPRACPLTVCAAASPTMAWRVLPRLPTVALSTSVPDFPAGIDSQKGADKHRSHRQRFVQGVGVFR